MKLNKHTDYLVWFDLWLFYNPMQYDIYAVEGVCSARVIKGIQ